jgi:hypothetical protein
MEKGNRARMILMLVIAGLLIILSFVWPERGWSARVDQNLVVLYDFKESSGLVITDKTADPLNLTIEGTGTEWLNPGIRVTQSVVAKAGAARTKLAASKFFTNGITIEAWVKPLNNTQSGPARIVTFSADSGNRNFTFGQEGDHYNQRFRTSTNAGNGNNPSLSTPATSIASNPVLQHVIYTRNSTGTANFYIDKLKVQAAEITGDGSNWNISYDFGLFNELNYPVDNRTWLGDIFLVAIYDKVLSSSEITQNFDAGVPIISGTGSVTLAWDANTEEDLAGYKIYYGLVSRGTDKLEQMQKWCDAHEPTNEKCLEEWKALCPEPLDRNCYTMLYDYDTMVNVANNPNGRAVSCPDPYDPFKTECCGYTLKNLEIGKTYFLAATAYDTENNESAFSIELTHIVDSKVGTVKNLKWNEEEQ